MSDLNGAARALLSRLQERDGADPGPDPIRLADIYEALTTAVEMDRKANTCPAVRARGECEALTADETRIAAAVEAERARIVALLRELAQAIVVGDRHALGVNRYDMGLADGIDAATDEIARGEPAAEPVAMFTNEQMRTGIHAAVAAARRAAFEECERIARADAARAKKVGYLRVWNRLTAVADAIAARGKGEG